jgi:hypothetical protein
MVESLFGATQPEKMPASALASNRRRRGRLATFIGDTKTRRRV